MAKIPIRDVDIYIFHYKGSLGSDFAPQLKEYLGLDWNLGELLQINSFLSRLPARSSGCDYDELRSTRRALSQLEEKHNVEIAIISDGIRRFPPKIAAFDMDSTLIQAEVIDELARGIGKMEAVAAITEDAMNGKVDFAESLQLRVKLLRGVPTTVWDDLKTRIEFMPGARELTRALKRVGVTTAVFSGGFQEMALWVGSELGLHRAAANKVSFTFKVYEAYV
jgi:HAD superfamily phosphoserine phosphatase-like hydrolase